MVSLAKPGCTFFPDSANPFLEFDAAIIGRLAERLAFESFPDSPSVEPESFKQLPHRQRTVRRNFSGDFQCPLFNLVCSYDFRNQPNPQRFTGINDSSGQQEFAGPRTAHHLWQEKGPAHARL